MLINNTVEMSALQQIISDAERLNERLKERQGLAEHILQEAECVNNQMDNMTKVMICCFFRN